MPRHKKRHHKVHHGHRRHKMGALNLKTQGDLVQLAIGAVTGGIAKRVLQNVIAKGSDSAGVTISDKTMQVGALVTGGLAFYFIDQPFVRGLGLGIAGAAVYDMSANLKLAGIGETRLIPFRPNPNVSGASATPNVGANVFSFPRPSGVGRARHFAGSHMR